VWQFDFASVFLTAPRSFCTLGFSLALPAKHPLSGASHGSQPTLLCCSFSGEYPASYTHAFCGWHDMT
jgi:hypothetical protein